MNNKYFEIDDEGKRLFITQTAMRSKLPAIVVEKDLWVTIVLQLPTAKIIKPFSQIVQVTEEKGIKSLALSKGVIKTSYAIQGKT